MRRDAVFLEGEIYHIYNRGAHKANIFFKKSDYERFKILLFLGNDTVALQMRTTLKKYQGRSLGTVFLEEEPDKGTVDVLSYALMPNHFHLILRQKSENGVTQFMKKVATAYSMYFNTAHEHSGTVFQGRFKSKHVGTSEYLRWLFAYVALNPLDVGFPEWKERGVNPQQAYSFLSSYPHASFPDLCKTENRPEAAMLSYNVLRDLGDDVPSFTDMRELFDIERMNTEDRPWL